MTASVDQAKLHDALDQAIIAIVEEELECSRRDPRVGAFHERAARLRAELDAAYANYD